ncbi:Periplasmic copper-binding protein (NosD) [uncultured archaeon]|nr:Periplasmic copper-binding protein (NosD) [uncultured archaeon]
MAINRTGLKYLIIALSLTLYLSVNVVAADGLVVTGAPTTTFTLTVNAAGGADYNKIQDAINNAGDGYTILVSGGVTYTLTYYENVNVNKSVKLKGIDNGKGMPVVNASKKGSTVTLNASNSTIEGFTIVSSGSLSGNAGIRVNSKNNTIRNNTVMKNNYGIYMAVPGNNSIYNNYFNNTYNFKTNGSNKWNSTKTVGKNINGGPFVGGNFWANPTGTGYSQKCADYNKDGICDISYTLATNNKDYLPLAVNDTVPPAGITGLSNVSYNSYYIKWNWTDPKDTDFSRVMIYLDGKFKINVSKGIKTYNATGLLANTQHTIATRTVDIYGNVNTTWMNNTARTAADSIPPANVSGLKNVSYAKVYIKWTWVDPPDKDFSKVMVYLDGIFKKNVSKGIKNYNATGLLAGTQHTIATRTVDVNGNLNMTWTNHTARTAP